MNLSVETLAPCKKLLRFEVDATEVDKTFEQVTSDFQKHVRLPGFRPGKAPRHLVVKSYATEIENEVKKKLISDTYREGLREQKLNVVITPDVEEIQFGRGKNLLFAATVETAPDFELPEYKGLSVKRETARVTDDDVERALGVLREQRASYADVTRPVKDGDFVVIDYLGSCEGKPITDTAPTARGLTEKKAFWVRVAPDSFIPGFTEQLVGASAGDKRTIAVTFPADFVSQPLAGKAGSFEVTVTGVKEKSLPEITDEFANSLGAEGVDALRAGVRNDLQNELDFKVKRSVRDQLVRQLMDQIQCDLPESVVQGETRNVVYEIVNENQRRGVPREAIDQEKEKIFSAASASAKDRVKSAFILGKIAAKEGIRAEDKEITQRILFLADQYQIKPEKFVKQLQDRNGVGEIRDQIVTAKVLDFLELNAKVEELLPGQSASPAASAPAS